MRRAAVPAGRAAAGIAHRLPAGWKPPSPHLLLWPGKALLCIGPAAPRGGERGVPHPGVCLFVFLVLLLSLSFSCLREGKKFTVTFHLPYSEPVCQGQLL